jgi:hypothetical protein
MIQDLSWLLYPFDKRSFIDHHLEKAPLTVWRGEKDYFQRLLSPDDVESILAKSASTNHADIVMVHPERVLAPAEYTRLRKLNHVLIQTGFDLGRIRQLFHGDKAFMRIQNIHNLQPSVRLLVQMLREELLCSHADATLHLMPPGAARTEATYAVHDIFLLQTDGTQPVYLYEPVVELPLGTQNATGLDVKQLTPVSETVIGTGGVVYIPRGFVFSLGATDAVSATLFIDLYNATWTRLLVDGVYALAGQSDVFRGGFFTPDLESASPSAKQAIFQQIKKTLLDALPHLEVPLHEATQSRRMPSLIERLSEHEQTVTHQ